MRRTQTTEKNKLQNDIGHKLIWGFSLGLFLLMIFPIIALGSSTTTSTYTNGSVTSVTLTTTGTIENVENGGATIILTLSGGGNWNALSSSQISTLITNLKETPDSTSWTSVQSALKSQITSSTSSSAITINSNVLTINLPAVPNYAPVTTQTLTFTIPTSFVASGSTSSTPSVDNSTATFGFPSTFNVSDYLDMSLVDGNFVNAFSQNTLNEIYINVPITYLRSISNSQMAMNSNVYVNSMNIYTDSSVKSVVISNVTGITTTGSVTSTGTPDSNYYISNTPLTDSKGNTYFNVGFTTPSPNYNLEVALYSSSQSNPPTSTSLATQAVQMAGTKSSYPPVTTDFGGYYSMYKLVNNPSLLTSIFRIYTPSQLYFYAVNT
jgi:hypothetical protein